MACCSNCTQRGCSIILIFFGCYNIIFLALLTALFKISLRDNTITGMRENIYPETPMYDLAFDNTLNNKYKKIYNFYTWGGVSEPSNIPQQNISKIYSKNFYYLVNNKSFLEYYKDYSVPSGENCKDSYKKCGILNTEGRILCLPNDEDCPLNDFAISDIDDDPNYPGYQKYLADTSKYFYYTNTKTDKPIIVDFKLSYGFPCISTEEKSWISVYENEKEKGDDIQCKTSVNGENRDKRYIEVQQGILLKRLYEDIHIYDSPATTQEVNLYRRNYIYSYDECISDFFEKISKASGAEIAIRVLGSISVALEVALIIYSITIRCCFVDYHLICIIAPIFCIIFNLVAILLNYTVETKYECEEFKDLINGSIKSDLDFLRSSNIIYIVFSLVGSIIILLICICMKNMKKIIVYDRSNGRMVQVIPQNQPVYIQQVPMNSIAYPQNVPYYNVVQYNNYQNQNQNLNFNPNLMNSNINSKNNFSGQ